MFFGDFFYKYQTMLRILNILKTFKSVTNVLINYVLIL